MIVLEPQQTTTDVSDAEALIKEARQRQRKRRLFIGIVLFVAMVVSGVREGRRRSAPLATGID